MPPRRFSHFLRFLLLSSVAIACLNCQSYPPQAVAVEASRKEETRVTFLAVGDIMLSRGVARRMAVTGDPLIPFKQLEALLKSTDFNFGNLESPISGKDGVFGRGLVFNAHTRDIAGLVEYNFKVLNLANNHAFDQRLAGLQSTQRYLEDRGITHLGVGDNLEEAWKPKIITINGLKIGFIGASYASVNDGGATRNNYVARIEDLDRLKKAVNQLKSESDFIIATMHAGTEYVAKPDRQRPLDKTQIDFARAAIDYGADLVIGAHPHWIQNMEVYSGKPIFYSLGNFIFDQHAPLTKEGLTLKITLHGEKVTGSSINQTNGEGRRNFTTRLEQIEFLPVIIENNSTPRLASVTEGDRILKRLSLPRKVTEPELIVERVQSK